MTNHTLKRLLTPFLVFLLICFLLYFSVQREDAPVPVRKPLNGAKMLGNERDDEEPTHVWFDSLPSDNPSIDIHPLIAESYYIPELNITYMMLANGMKVCLKPTDFESDEIIIKLVANGGYGVLPGQDRPSGELAAPIAWESGMGGLTSDQVSVLLYEHSLDFSLNIKAFSREIEGSASNAGLRAFLESMRMVFTHPNFTEEAKEVALGLAANAIKKDSADYEQSYEAIFAQVNAPGVQALRPLVVDDLKKVDLAKSQKFFRECFGDPADFICVIVGSFNLTDTKELVARILGGIPKREGEALFVQNVAAPFPAGVINKVVTLQGRNDCLTRVTFPLQMEVNENTIHLIEYVCQVIEARVRNVLTANMPYPYGVDVSYEFPLYPYLVNPWVSIRYRSSEAYVNSIKNRILSELGLLQTQGASEEEIAEIKRLQSGSEEYWLQDNFYWTSVLSNYYLWGWNPLQIVDGEKEVSRLSVAFINAALKNSFFLGNYSVVTAKP